MKNYIDITRQVTTRTPLKREPTKVELRQIMNDELFDIPDDIIDWDKEETTDEDYSYAKISVVYNEREIGAKRGKY